jgi:hypothetical protein
MGMPEQYLSTSRLGNVIQLIALGNQTGVLKVTRGQGSIREQGEIHFVNGQPTFAILGQIVGNAALTILQNWGESHYLFLEGPLPQPERTPHAAGGSGRAGDQTSPAAGFGPRLVPRTPAVPNWPLPGAPTGTSPLSQPTGPQPGRPGSDNIGYFPAGGSGESRFGSSSPLPPFPRHEPFQGSLVLRRTSLMDRLDNLPLDRRERMVLLLIDGHRSVADLVRLTRRGEQEVQQILSHLASLGLIE